MTDESKKSVSARAMAKLRRFLTRNEWHYVQGKDGTLRGLSTGNGVQWHWLARPSNNGNFLLVYAYCPADVRQDKRPAAAEYLTRSTWGLNFGSFDMDWTDGQACFRTAIPLGPGGASKQAMEHLFWGNCMVMERYLPGLLAVAMGDASPEQAVLDAERDLRPAAEPAPAESQATQTPWPRRFSASDN